MRCYNYDLQRKAGALVTATPIAGSSTKLSSDRMRFTYPTRRKGSWWLLRLPGQRIRLYSISSEMPRMQDVYLRAVWI